MRRERDRREVGERKGGRKERERKTKKREGKIVTGWKENGVHEIPADASGNEA